MILDSCYSGSVMGKDFRPGPLGDASFGQLSYDKGMLMMLAAQPAQAQLGGWTASGEGKTALVEALEDLARADPGKDLAAWLKGAEKQVPLRVRQRYPEWNSYAVPQPEMLDFGDQVVRGATRR